MSPVTTVPEEPHHGDYRAESRDQIQTPWSVRSRPGYVLGLPTIVLALVDGVDPVMPAAPQVVPGDPEQEHPSHHERTKDGVGERCQCGVVGEHGPHVSHDRPAVLAELDAHGVLHPRVGDDDEVRRDPGSDHRAPQGREVHALAQPAPAEDPDTEEGKVDSRKKASRPSSASGAPNTSPTNREYSLQAIPNWNSWTRPVATPKMKLMR